MTLPRELRDKIYDNLLLIETDWSKRHKDHRTPNYKPQLSILRVNRALHKEASETLYERNALVCITLKRTLLEALCDLETHGRWGFTRNRLVPTASFPRIAAVATARMVLRDSLHRDPGDDQLLLLIPSYSVPRLCHHLSLYNIKVSKIELHVHLTSHKLGKVKTACHEYMLDWFEEARGFERVTIADTHGSPSHVELATLMSSFPSPSECVNRASKMRDCALRNRELGWLSEARDEYLEGFYSILHFCEVHHLLHGNYDPIQEKSSTLLPMLRNFAFSFAFLSIKLGIRHFALFWIDFILKSWLIRTSNEMEKAEAWFLYGIRDLEVGADNGAAYCFLQALKIVPGHPDTEAAVDEMEARLKCCTGLTESTILHNIQHVLQPLRHQTHGSAVMSKGEFEVLLQQWDVGQKDTNSIGYRFSSAGSTSLDKSNRSEYTLDNIRHQQLS